MALLQALWADLPRAKFATGGEIDAAYPMPASIRVEGAGDLTLPLSHEDFLKLKAVSTQAPRGEQTLLDTDVRRAWQVEASKVSCPQMPDFFCKVARDVAVSAVKELGVDADALGLEVRLYKLLLYEQGGHFKIHRDTEKEDGMFATMILQLPTQEGHEGGELKVHHGQKNLAFDFSGAKSVTSYFKTVFFCDCKHELAEVRSGSRLCLAFNLLRNNAKFTDTSQVPHYISAVGQVQRLLKQWSDWVTPRAPILAIPLGYKYTLNTLSFAGLKGYDRVVAALVLSCANFLDIHLCMLQKKLLLDMETDHVVSEKYYISNWTSLDDAKSRHLEYCKFDISNVVRENQNDPFAFCQEPDVGPEVEDGDHLTTYYAAVLVVWPKDRRMEALCTNGQYPYAVVNWLDEQHIQEPDRTGRDFQTYLAALTEKQDHGFMVHDFRPLLDFSIRHDLREATFTVMRKWLLELIGCSVNNTTTIKLVVSAIQKYGWDNCYREAIRKPFEERNLSSKFSQLGAFVKRLRENGLDGPAVCVAKQLLHGEDLSSRNTLFFPDLLEVFVGCGLEEEAWQVVNTPWYFNGQSLALVAGKWGEKSFPQIEAKLNEEEGKHLQSKSPFANKRRFLEQVVLFVVALDEQGSHDAALAFAKKFLKGEENVELSWGTDVIALLLCCGEKCHERVRRMKRISDAVEWMKRAANLIGLKKDKKVTQLFSELLSKVLHCRDFEGILVLDCVLWLGDETLINDLVGIVQRDPSVIDQVLAKAYEYCYDIPAQKIASLAMAWGDAGKEGFRKVVKAVLQYIQSDTRLCDDDGSGCEENGSEDQQQS